MLCFCTMDVVYQAEAIPSSPTWELEIHITWAFIIINGMSTRKSMYNKGRQWWRRRTKRKEVLFHLRRGTISFSTNSSRQCRELWRLDLAKQLRQCAPEWILCCIQEATQWQTPKQNVLRMFKAINFLCVFKKKSERNGELKKQQQY